MRTFSMLLVLGLLVAGCSDERDPVDSGGIDSGTMGVDSGMVGMDSGPGTDSGPGVDAGERTDSGIVPGTDSGIIPGRDGGIVPGTDGSIIPGEGGLPGGCTMDSDCASGQMCCMVGGVSICLPLCV